MSEHENATTEPERPAPDESDDHIHDELDPQFRAILAYVEAAAAKFAEEMRDARPNPVIVSRPGAPRSAVEAETVPDPEPGTAEYDRRNGIPYYKLT